MGKRNEGKNNFMDGEIYYIEHLKEGKYTEMVAGLILHNYKTRE